MRVANFVPGYPGPTVQTSLTIVNGTVYRNTGPYPIIIIVQVSLKNLGDSAVAYADASNPPTTAVAGITQPTGGITSVMTFTFLVLPGNYYRVVLTAGTSTIGTCFGWGN